MADDVSARGSAPGGRGSMEKLFLIMNQTYRYGREKLLNEMHFVLRRTDQGLT
jgi:hypothetical protein